MTPNNIEKFIEVFGEDVVAKFEGIPKNFLVYGPSRIVALAKKDFEWRVVSPFKKYSLNVVPRKDKKIFDLFEYNKILYQFYFIRSIIKFFLKGSSFRLQTIELRSGDGSEKVTCLCFDLGDSYLVQAPLTEDIEEILELPHLKVYEGRRKIKSEEIFKSVKMKGFMSF